MYFRGPAVGLTYCCFYLASYFTNKYVLSVLKFTYPTLFQGWQTFVGGLLLHVCWKLGWVEINTSSRADVLSWLPVSALFVGIIYAGSRALSRLPIPVFLTLHNAAQAVSYGIQRLTRKEQSSYTKTFSILLLLVSAGCLPLHDSQFDADGYFWGVIHLVCVGCYKVFQKSQKSSLLSDLDQQYINYVFRGSPQCLGVSISLFLQVSQWVLCQWDFGILAGAYFSEVKGQPLLSTSCVLEFLCQGYYSWFVTGFLRYYNECTTDFMLPDWCPRRSTACLYRAGRSIKTNLEDMKSPLFHHRTQNVGLSELYIAPTHTHRTDAENVGPERRLTVYPFEGKLLLLPGKHYQDAWLPLRG
ncbi:UDP-N-acetylglucosamine transporter TMEM241 isoform X1 [Ascaphus truei]|uniref:UDP-N-acetylglucosamine transporter TMEM241 isoform X1 n=1 Tax=Ascaphus truei TaxID=8439 RepID=UPI003F5A10A6